MALKAAHPTSEGKLIAYDTDIPPCLIDTFDGQVSVEWDSDAHVTPLGQLPFFIHFLKLGGRFETWVEDCPLYYNARNAPDKVDVLGSLFLSILSGHSRYKHLTALRNDTVNSRLLGMNKVVSEDSARRGLKRIEEQAGIQWLQTHLLQTIEPLLNVPWILDVDVTVKPIYGHQEGGEIAYNTQKPGRPSQTLHTYMMAGLRLVLDVDVQSGKQSASCYSLPGLCELIKRLPVNCRPAFVRGDCAWGTERVMCDLEDMGIDYLFRLKQSAKVKELIYQHHNECGWQDLGSGYEGKESMLNLSGWTSSRRVVVVRQRLSTKDNDALLIEKIEKGQQSLPGFIEGPEDFKLYRYGVLVTSLTSDIVSIAAHYRDRADCENVFDEIKNQWGWGGFTTRDLSSSQLMSRMIALVYNWWTLFVRLANPDGRHKEAISSRPALLSSVGRLIRTGRQTKLKVTSHHSRADVWRAALRRLSELFSTISAAARQHKEQSSWQRLMAYLIKKLVPNPQLGCAPMALP